MPIERKKLSLSFEGANPVAIVELDDEDPPDASTPDQEAAANAVSLAVMCYIKTTKDLVSTNGKYSHLRDKIPEYMATPGNVLIAICTNGIVIRYEKETDPESKRVITAIMPEGITEIAALLSQDLIQIESDDTPHPPKDNFGARIQLCVFSPSDGTRRDLCEARIWFHAKPAPPQQPALLGAKPYCLLSVRSQIVLELEGELCPEGDASIGGQPFMARTPIRLMVGWECIEVFPEFRLDAWKSDFAPLWAEYDVLGAALIAHTMDAQLRELDPRASTRCLYAALLADFKALLDSNPEREQTLQTFLQKNPILLCPTHIKMWPKLPFGATVTDFVFRDATQQYLLVELERSTLKLFREDGHPTADLTHAHGQIVDWKRYLEDNLPTVQRELGLAGITPNPHGLLVIGRSQSVLPKDRRKLQTMMNESPKLQIMTYDDVYANAKAVFENMLGPMSDTGGDTRVYYPQLLR